MDVRSNREGLGLATAADRPRTPRCAAIIIANPASRVAGLKAATAAMTAEGVTSVRVGNPLSSPLTLHRILIQIGLHLRGRDDDDDSADDDEARIVRRLGGHGAADRVVLVIEQAETLEPAALLSLQRLASGPGSVLLLLVGAPSFWALLDGPGLAPLRRALAGFGAREASAAPPVAVASSGAAVPPVAEAALYSLVDEPAATVAQESGRRWWLAGAAGLVAIGVLGVAAVLAPGGLFYYASPHQLAPTLRGLAAVRQTPSDVPPAPPMPATAAEVPAVPLQTGVSGPSQSPAARTPGAAPLLAAASSGSRVVVHYRDGSATGAAEADRLAAAAAPSAARVQTRAVADTPSAPVIRFFHPEDAARARQLAGVLGGAGAGWEVRDFSSYRPSPSAGTIEVWTPAR